MVWLNKGEIIGLEQKMLVIYSTDLICATTPKQLDFNETVHKSSIQYKDVHKEKSLSLWSDYSSSESKFNVRGWVFQKARNAHHSRTPEFTSVYDCVL